MSVTCVAFFLLWRATDVSVICVAFFLSRGVRQETLLPSQSVINNVVFSAQGTMIAMCLPEPQKSSPTCATCRFLEKKSDIL